MTPKGRKCYSISDLVSKTAPTSLQGLLPELVEVVASVLEPTDLKIKESDS